MRSELRRLLVCTPALAGGVWLLISSLPVQGDVADGSQWLAALLGAGLLAAAAGLADGRAGAWVLASLLALTLIVLEGTVWARGGGVDWGTLLAGLALLLALTAPSVREDLLAAP
jgi:hypothetical protein